MIRRFGNLNGSRNVFYYERKEMNIRRVLSVAVAIASLAGASVLAQQNNPQPNRREQERRSQQEQRDMESLVQLVDAVIAGKQPAPSDIQVSWSGNHFVKGAADATYIPFTLTVDASKLAAPGVAFYVRAVSKNAAPAPAAPPAEQNNNNRDRNQQRAAPTHPWEDVQFFDLPQNGKVSRALMVNPGEYDLFVAIKEKTPQQQQRNAPPQKVGVLRQTLNVPGFNGPELSISTPILAESITQLQAAPSAEEQRTNPYVFGVLQVVPGADDKLKTSENLEMLFWIYGLQDNNGMPDVQIEYNFYVKAPDAEKFFNKTQPQVLNQSALPAGFNIKAGHQVPGNLAVPLKSFPPGDYRAEIKVTDKLSGKTLTHNVTFTVEA